MKKTTMARTIAAGLLCTAVFGVTFKSSASSAIFSTLNQPITSGGYMGGQSDVISSDFLTGTNPVNITGATFSFQNTDDIGHVMTPHLFANLDGLPGALVGSFTTFTLAASANPGSGTTALYNTTPTAGISLNPNTIYWMAVSIDQATDLPYPVVWNDSSSQSSTGVFTTIPATPLEFSADGGATWSPDNIDSGADSPLFALSGVAVPEPSSALLLLSALGLPLLRRVRAGALNQ